MHSLLFFAKVYAGKIRLWLFATNVSNRQSERHSWKHDISYLAWGLNDGS